ncbi:MAG: hypothetical protein WC624_06520 [Candidatus Margulisiibacteriota bacterium]
MIKKDGNFFATFSSLPAINLVEVKGITRYDLKQNSIFMGLRLLDGLPAEKFVGFEKEVAELLKDGLLEAKNGIYRLTRHGLFLGNLVFEKFV